MSFLHWVALQAVSFGRVVGLLLFGSLVALVRRQLSLRAVGAALFVMVLGLHGVVFATYGDGARYGGTRADVLWLGCFGVSVLAGLVAGRVGRRIAVWELHLVFLVTGVLVFVQLLKGWHEVVGLGGSDKLSTWDLMHLASPGERYLGPLWDRLTAVALVAGYVLAVFGGSLGFLFLGEQRRSGYYERLVSRRHLTGEAHGIVSATALVAVVGIGVGVAALVTTTAVMSGYQENVRQKILSIQPHLVVRKYGIDFVEYPEVRKKILSIPGAEAAAPFIINEAMMSDGDRGIAVLVKGVRPEEAAAVTDIEKSLCSLQEDGTCRPDASLTLESMLSRADGAPAAILGTELFRRLGQPVGSTVLITTPIGIAGSRGNAPKRLSVRIGGVFRSGIHDFDARLMYLELGTAQRLLGTGQAVYGLEVRVADPERVDEVSKQVLRLLGGFPYVTQDWRTMNAGIFMALNLLKIVMFLVLVFIIVVASFNIASTLFMAVVERAREIAILKSMGARDPSIMRIFVTQGWVIGGAGTLLGLLIGFGLTTLLGNVSFEIAADVYMVERLTVRLLPSEIITTMVASFVISHLATLHPALKAAGQRPVDAMRYD